MKEIFTYGTLKTGGKWHHLIANEVFQGIDSIKADLRIEQEAYYPVLFMGTSLVQGEIWSISDSAYQKVWELESDANYQVETVTTTNGKQVIVFFMKDEGQKNKFLKIENFDQREYFRKWLKETDKKTPAYQFFLNWGGQS